MLILSGLYLAGSDAVLQTGMCLGGPKGTELALITDPFYMFS